MADPEHRAELSDRLRPWFLFLLRPVVAYPIFILMLLAAAPIIYRSMQFHGIPQIDDIVDPEVDGRVTMAPRDNAFTYYNYAESLLPPRAGNVETWSGIRAIESGKGWEAVPQDVRDYLGLSQAALDEWKLGTELDDAHYRDVADYSLSTKLPMTRELMTFAGLAILQSLRCLDEGKTDEAWQWLKAVLRSSRHPGQHGVAVERLVGITIHKVAAQAIVAWATQDEITSEQLREVLDQIREINRLTPKTSTTMKAEAIAASNAMSNSRDLRMLVKGRFAPGELLPFYMFVKGDPQLSTELIRHVFANYLSQCDKPPIERDRRRGILSLYRPTGRESPPLMDPDGLSEAVMNSLFARQLVPAVSQMPLICDREHSRQDALDLCLVVEMYRRKHGDYPATLAALVPKFVADVPVDWMGKSSTDKMLLVRRNIAATSGDNAEAESDQVLLPSWLIIYSRGSNGDGDGDGGDLEYDNDVGLRIPLKQPGSRQQ
jgi:hypothetical protein